MNDGNVMDYAFLAFSLVGNMSLAFIAFMLNDYINKAKHHSDEQLSLLRDLKIIMDSKKP